MANGKKRRKQKKRSKIKIESVLPTSTNQVKVIDDCSPAIMSPAIMSPAYKNLKNIRIAKSKGNAFVPLSCLTSYCSTPYQAINKTKLEYYQPPQIETTHIFNGVPTKKIRRRKHPGNCTVIVPPSCLNINQVSQSFKKINDNTYAKPIILEKVSEIIMPAKYYRSKRRWFTSASIVPLSCVTSLNSVVKTFPPQQQKKIFYSPPAEHKPSPPIIGPERHFMRRHKKYGNNNLIVLDDCIIQPKPVSQVSIYDWRKAFPKPITLDKVADIVGPTIKIRTKKHRNTNSGFVPASCIITQKEIPPPELKPAVEEHTEAEAVALTQVAPTTSDSDKNLYFLVVAVIVAVITFAFVFSQ